MRPTAAKMASASSVEGRRHSGARRSAPYHAIASSQVWPSESAAPCGWFHALHHRETCSSDRKSRIVLHVKTMLSQKRRAGTSKWTTPAAGSRLPPATRTDMGNEQQPQVVSIRASRFSIAAIPSASQAQFPW